MKHKVSWFIIHHTRKPTKDYEPVGLSALRGSGEFAAFADVVMIVRQHKDRGNRIMLVQEKNRNSQKVDPIMLQVVDYSGGIVFEQLEGGIPATHSVPKKKAELVADEIREWIKQNAIQNFVRKNIDTKFGYDKQIKKGYRGNALNNALAILIKEGIIAREHKGSYSVKGVVP